MSTSALVLFSGGQDSATCLAWALERYERVETVGFDYGQRHSVELAQRAVLRERFSALRERWRLGLGQDHVLDLRALGTISDTAMTREIEIRSDASGLPNTFVPGRNLIFLAFAAALAHRRGLTRIVAGMCETDFSGYPDCRDDAIKAMQVALNIGMDARFVLETPLMWTDKAGVFALAYEIGGEALAEAIIEESHTCYLGIRGDAHAWGRGCGACPACKLRAEGFARWMSTRA